MPKIEASLQDTFVSSIIRRIFIAAGNIFVNRLEKDAEHAALVNTQTLRKILKHNQNTKFGRSHGFAEILASKDVEAAFKARVAISRYDDYQNDIEAIKRGENNILFADIVTGIAASAGTTGATKMVPVTAAHMAPAVRFMGMMSGTIAHEHFLGTRMRQKGICLLSTASRQVVSEGGAVIGVASGIGMKKMGPMLHHIWTSPTEVYSLEDDTTARYLHALYGLRYRPVEYISATFAPYVLQWITVMINRWADLVEDIEHGTLNAELYLPAGVRKKLEAGLTPDPARAAELRQAAASGFEGILPRVWPNLQYIDTVATGSFAMHQPALNYYAGPVPTYSSFYGMSEVSVGVGLWPDQAGSYLLYLDAAYFEFLEVKEEAAAEVPAGESARESHPEGPLTAIGIDELETGNLYEVVATTRAGLYRYRTGDVIKMVGHYKETPVLEFSHRRGLAMDLAGEKTSEQQVRSAVENLLPDWLGESALLRDFTTHGRIEAITAHYVFYLELMFGGSVFAQAAKTLSKASALIDKHLVDSNYMYRRARKGGVLGPPVVKLVEEGTFDHLHQQLVERHPTNNRTQIKIPVNLKAEELVEVMESRVLAVS